MSGNDDLEPLEPREAKELYELDREGEVSEATLRSHGYRIERFCEWCDEQDVDNLNTLSGRDIQRFKMARKKEVNQTTLKSQMDTLRVLLRFCKSINGVDENLPESVNSPSLADEDARGTDIVTTGKSKRILSYLDKYRYASIQHALFRLLWESGMRMGSARSVDLRDFHPSAEYVKLNHRPGEDTPLKNGERGERNLALTTRTCHILRDYIDEHRHDVSDEYGRDPLFTTSHGRITKNTLRTYIYRVTRPCEHGRECPHGREPEQCEARESRMTASKCPDSTAPHSVRRGAITHWLKQDKPTRVVSDRMNVSQEIISEHYDARSQREKMEQRRDYLGDI